MQCHAVLLLGNLTIAFLITPSTVSYGMMSHVKAHVSLFQWQVSWLRSSTRLHAMHFFFFRPLRRPLLYSYSCVNYTTWPGMRNLLTTLPLFFTTETKLFNVSQRLEIVTVQNLQELVLLNKHGSQQEFSQSFRCMCKKHSLQSTVAKGATHMYTHTQMHSSQLNALLITEAATSTNWFSKHDNGIVSTRIEMEKLALKHRLLNTLGLG